MAKRTRFDTYAVLLTCAIVASGLLLLPASVALADCTNPPGGEGDQLYNADHKTMQFCDGTDWWAMKGAEAGLPSCAVGDGIVMTSAGYWACSPGGPP